MNEVNDINKREFSASIEQLVETDETIELILDGLETTIINQLIEIPESNRSRMYELISSVDINIFILSLRKDKYANYEEFTEDSWISFNLLQMPTDIEILLYDSQFFDEEPKILYIEDLKPIKISDKTKIFTMDSFEESTQEKIKNQIDSIVPYFLKHILVYNVGQGNCNAIMDYCCKPIFFYDFGGGIYNNTKTYPGNYLNPQTIQYNFERNPFVILSHWDWDHMASYLRNEHIKIKDSTWIVPKQNLGISHLKVAIELYNKGNLLVWPNNITKIKTHQIKIQKLNGSDKNNSGLVLTVYIDALKSKAILLPSDANYNLIEKNKENYIGLVATHHGASTHNYLSKIPQAYLNSNKIAFSFGAKNTYNHPNPQSIYSHCTKGWSNVYFTVNGHVCIPNQYLCKCCCYNNGEIQ